MNKCDLCSFVTRNLFHVEGYTHLGMFCGQACAAKRFLLVSGKHDGEEVCDVRGCKRTAKHGVDFENEELTQEYSAVLCNIHFEIFERLGEDQMFVFPVSEDESSSDEESPTGWELTAKARALEKSMSNPTVVPKRKERSPSSSPKKTIVTVPSLIYSTESIPTSQDMKITMLRLTSTDSDNVEGILTVPTNMAKKMGREISIRSDEGTYVSEHGIRAFFLKKTVHGDTTSMYDDDQGIGIRLKFNNKEVLRLQGLRLGGLILTYKI